MSKSMILKPRLSEKTYALSQTGVFVFVVPKDANKHEVKLAVEKTYDVSVTNVRIVVQQGKTSRQYRNRRFVNGERSDFKKAYVTLKEGDSIPIFAAVEEAESEEK